MSLLLILSQDVDATALKTNLNIRLSWSSWRIPRCSHTREDLLFILRAPPGEICPENQQNNHIRNTQVRGAQSWSLRASILHVFLFPCSSTPGSTVDLPPHVLQKLVHHAETPDRFSSGKPSGLKHVVKAERGTVKSSLLPSLSE